MQLRDEPVAHSERTLRDVYQIRDRAGLQHYQRKVSDVLNEQVRHAKATTQLAFFSVDDVRAARSHPDATAARLGIRLEVLEQTLEGSLDTVLSACTDNTNGPYNPGTACLASFLMCLGCPCALATPTHWHAIVATYDRIEAERFALPQIEWATRYGEPFARLSDLLGRLPEGAAARARAEVSEKTRAMVDRMLTGQLEA